MVIAVYHGVGKNKDVTEDDEDRQEDRRLRKSRAEKSKNRMYVPGPERARSVKPSPWSHECADVLYVGTRSHADGTHGTRV